MILPVDSSGSISATKLAPLRLLTVQPTKPTADEVGAPFHTGAHLASLHSCPIRLCILAPPRYSLLERRRQLSTGKVITRDKKRDRRKTERPGLQIANPKWKDHRKQSIRRWLKPK
jgi:hypothetical protein